MEGKGSGGGMFGGWRILFPLLYKLEGFGFFFVFCSFCALCICISVCVFIHFLKTFRLIQVKISFKLKGVALQTIHARELPDCYAFQNTVSIEYDTSNTVYIIRV